MPRHHVESFTEGSEWGWQCLTCGWEATGYEDLDAAESASDQHAAETEATT